MQRLAYERQQQIISLRKVGKSIPEISRETGIAKTTVTRYVAGVSIPSEFAQLLKEKQGGAKNRALGLRENVLTEAQRKLGTFTERDRLMILVGLYWGEGTKRDFSIINSDPSLIQTFLQCLESLGISKERLRFSLRVHSNISISKAKNHWATLTGLPIDRIGRIEVIEGKKKGKLPYGMCRVRVIVGIRERLLIQSLISLIGKDSGKKLLSA